MRVLKIATVVTAAVLIVVFSTYLVVKGYELGWTGFAGFIDPEGKSVPPKRLWDWMSLLIVPLFLALAAWWLNNSRKAADAMVENDRQRQKSLDDYFAWMTEVLLEGYFDMPEKSENARSLARTRTLTALRVLDGERKGQLLQFLYESGMIAPSPKIQLNGADFRRAALDEATLGNVELRGVYFNNASFRRANLTNADLRGSDFTSADFTDAQLKSANFTQAILKAAKLQSADLNGAILDDADLTRAKLPFVSKCV